jgi:hypothetical protein
MLPFLSVMLPAEGVGNAYTVPKFQELGRPLLNPVDKLSMQCIGMINQSGPVLQQRRLCGFTKTLSEVGIHAWVYSLPL